MSFQTQLERCREEQKRGGAKQAVVASSRIPIEIAHLEPQTANQLSVRLTAGDAVLPKSTSDQDIGNDADGMAFRNAELDLIILGSLKLIRIEAYFPEYGSAKSQRGVKEPDPFAQGDREIAGIAWRPDCEAPRAIVSVDLSVGTNQGAFRMFIQI